jgi:hypothetical protein
VLDLRRESHVAGDDRDRLVHDDALVGAEVVDVSARIILVPAGGGEDRGHAVLHVEVGLALAAVAEHAQAGRVAAKRVVEIEDVTVRVALSEDRHEPKDEPRESISRGICLDQPLAGQLGRRVERRLDREGSILGRREHLGLPVHGAG